jgi:hypothetical protein
VEELGRAPQLGVGRLLVLVSPAPMLQPPRHSGERTARGRAYRPHQYRFS